MDEQPPTDSILPDEPISPEQIDRIKRDSSALQALADLSASGYRFSPALTDLLRQQH